MIYYQFYNLLPFNGFWFWFADEIVPVIREAHTQGMCVDVKAFWVLEYEQVINQGFENFTEFE